MTQTQPEEQQSLTTDELQALIGTALTSLMSKLPDVAEFVDSRRQGGLGFATPDALEAMDDQIRAERRDRAAAYKWLRDHQLHWNLLHDLPAPSGETKAPGNITIWAFLSEVDAVLIHEIRRLERAFNTAGVCPMYRLPANPSTRHLAGHLRSLTWHVTNTRILDRIHHQLEHLLAGADRILEGHDDRLKLREPCPHCGRMTLVVYLSGDQEGITRCEPSSRDPKQCVCPHEHCACKTNPRHRHEWRRDKGTAHSGWWALVDLINRPKTHQ